MNKQNHSEIATKKIKDLFERRTKEVYLSLKLGTTTTFFNVGVKKVIPADDIKAYNIQTKEGKQLLDAFGLNHKLFCDVFNQKLDRQIIERVQLRELDELLKTGIGEGYHIIHKLSGKILSKKMDRNF